MDLNKGSTLAELEGNIKPLELRLPELNRGPGFESVELDELLITGFSSTELCDPELPFFPSCYAGILY
jgi:hypothetical protein